ncbi:ATP-binding cassette domain-containing protein [Sporomusa malonica]|uniref:ATP-binding cassette domain-containing protein n=1 Tax=Sporomusa malonica TaxID=112901 RepID=UPI001593C890|nr:ATP-binding cassette domain-containing protein [Sporomusa malonica]
MKEPAEGILNITCAFLKGVNIILGPNGSGKTTLLQVLAGMLLPRSGTLTVDGKTVNQPQLRSLISYLPQTLGLYPQLTAREMLDYIALLKGIANKRTRKISVESALLQVGLVAAADQNIGTFSRGMRQKVGIAQALLGDPQIVLLDEPTAGLDPEERSKLRLLLARLGQQRLVIFASSLLADIQCAERILILDKGKKAFEGTAGELAASVPLLNRKQNSGTGSGLVEEGYKAVLASRANR